MRSAIDIKLVREPFVTRNHATLGIFEYSPVGRTREVGDGEAMFALHLWDWHDAMQDGTQSHTREKSQRITDVADRVTVLWLPNIVTRCQVRDLKAPLLR